MMINPSIFALLLKKREKKNLKSQAEVDLRLVSPSVQILTSLQTPAVTVWLSVPRALMSFLRYNCRQK